MKLAVGLALMNVLFALVMVAVFYPVIIIGLLLLIGAYAIGCVAMSEYYLWKGL